MQQKLIITFNWHSPNPIPENHVEQLKEDAESRIFSEIQRGITTGELHTTIHNFDTEADDEYSGWWTLSRDI